MRIFLVLVLILHGLIHLLGFMKAYSLAEISRLTLNISKPAGLLWLFCAFLFLAGAALFLLKQESWWMIAGPALLLSQVLIFFAWSDGKYGTLVNLIILLPVAVSFLNAQPSSFRSRYEAEARKGLARLSDMPLLTDADVRHLPKPVQQYLHYTGAVGRPKVQNFRVLFAGAMRFEKKDPWMDIEARQYEFFDDPTRVFYIESRLHGVPFDGLHLYAGSSATMQIKVASLFQVVDARGEAMTQSETVTLFNDMCLLAPATLIDRNIAWETIDPLIVKARFTNKGTTITALLYFNDKGELINFVSDDRYWSKDGKTVRRYRWSTPVREYRDFNGRKAAGYAEAVWHTPEGEYAYAKFNVLEIEYNCREYK